MAQTAAVADGGADGGVDGRRAAEAAAIAGANADPRSSECGGGDEGWDAPTEAEQRTLFGGALAPDYYVAHGVTHEARFIRNSRGMKLFTQIWAPAKRQPAPKALLCMCHGYGNDTSWVFQLMSIQFAAAGFVVAAIDYEGHGRSDGLRCGFKSVDAIAADCAAYFAAVRARSDLRGLPAFLYGESLGSAVALLLVSKHWLTEPSSSSSNEAEATSSSATPSLPWTGLVLSAPMLRIKDEVRPHWAVVQFLRGLSILLPDAPIVPTEDTIRFSCRDPQRLELATANPLRYTDRPRLATAVELVRATDEVTALFSTVAVPFLIIHGDADVVTDPNSSKLLHDTAPSKDKTLKLYRKGWHQLLSGEPEKERNQVFKDVIEWLVERSMR